MSSTSEAAAVVALADAAAAPAPLPDLGATLVRHRDGAVVLHHETAQKTPNAKRGTATLGTVDDLLSYVARHKTDATTLWVPDETDPTGYVVAILDDHGDTNAGWGAHAAQVALRHTPEWNAWTRASGSMMDQNTFAEFLEDNALDIDEPSPATLLEIATTFQSRTSTDFEAVTHLDSGAMQVKFAETTSAKAGKYGSVEIPKTFTILVAPYVGEARYRLTARLRHRARGGDLKLGFILDRPHVVIRDALGKIRDRIIAAGHDHTYVGSPIAGPRVRRLRNHADTYQGSDPDFY